MVRLSARFESALMVGIQLDAKDPFKFNFLFERGQKKLFNDAKKEEYRKLVKYFLAALTVPNDEMWVNLSPYEHDRIIPDNFGLTEMGRDLLVQDYLLKQITSSMIHPDNGAAKEFWKKVYQKAFEKYGTSDVPLDTFNKVWIVPDTATILHRYDTALIVENHLKVMMEQDYFALEKNRPTASSSTPQEYSNGETTQLAADVVREIVLPLLEKEVNEGENFAPLRQVYSSMLMATWFKKSLKESLLGQVYADKSRVAGVELNNPKQKEEIYQKYLQAYKLGVFSFIKDDVEPLTQEVIPRKYFSGGTKAYRLDQAQEVDSAEKLTSFQRDYAVKTQERGIDKAAVVLNVAYKSGTAIVKNVSDSANEQRDRAMIVKKDLFRIMSENARLSLIGLTIGLSVRGYELEEAVQNYDERLGVYVIPDDVMSILGRVGGMETGQGFNLLGHIGLKASTVAAIKTGSKEAIYELRHEQAHNKYREKHSGFPYQSVEQGLIDEIYAHLDGFMLAFGRDELFVKRALQWGEHDWFENLLNILVNHYVKSDLPNRDEIVKKLSYTISIIKLCFQNKQDNKIMSYIRDAETLDEILGIMPLEHQQWLSDAKVQPKNHAEIREKWSQFKPDAAQSASELTTMEHFNKSRLYLQMASGAISPEQYYAELRQVVRPDVQVMLDLGQERGGQALKLFEQASKEIGVDLAPLLVEPGISSRADDFVAFVHEFVQRNQPIVSADDLRNQFATHLDEQKVVQHPQGKLYFRGLRLLKEEKDRIVKQGLNSRVTDGVLARYTAKDLDNLEQHKSQEEMVRELEEGHDSDRGIGNAILWEMESLGSLQTDIDFRLKPESVPFCISQSITEVEQLAKDITMVKGVWDNKRDGDGAYVLSLDISEIYVINGNALVNKGKPTTFITSDGQEYNFPDSKVESFVQVPIQADWIKKVEPYQETNKTFREKGQSADTPTEFSGQVSTLKAPRIKRIKRTPDFSKMDSSRLVSVSISIPGQNPKLNEDAAQDTKWHQGGIDLDSGMLNMKVRRDGIGMPLPLPLQDPVLMHIEGLSPTILEITPVNAMPIFSELQTGRGNLSH